MRPRGFALVLAASCMFGIATGLVEPVTASLDPILATGIGLVCGGLCCVGTLAFSKHLSFPKLSRSGWRDLLLLAGVGTALPTILVLEGLHLTDVIKGGILLQSQGAVAIILAVLFLGERIAPRHIGGIVLLALGGMLVILKHWQAGLWEGISFGDVLVLGAAVGFGYGLVLSKKLSAVLPPLHLTAARMLLGAIPVLPIVLIRHQWLDGPLAVSLFWALPGYILFGYSLAYIAQNEGLRSIKGWEVAALTQTLPVFTALFAILALRETLTLTQGIGGCLAIGGGVVIALPEGARTRFLPILPRRKRSKEEKKAEMLDDSGVATIQ
jgi:drug/metabolite transporter (DMT)-like permease